MVHVGSLGMGVMAEFRGQGIGSKLLASVIQHAWETGLKRLELEVFADNEAAIVSTKNTASFKKVLNDMLGRWAKTIKTLL